MSAESLEKYLFQRTGKDVEVVPEAVVLPNEFTLECKDPRHHDDFDEIHFNPNDPKDVEWAKEMVRKANTHNRVLCPNCTISCLFDIFDEKKQGLLGTFGKNVNRP